MNKLHVKKGNAWLPVFAHKNGEIITCEHAPEKALPPLAIWASDDLEFFAKKFANEQFSIRYIPRYTEDKHMTAPELLKAQMPVVREIEGSLLKDGYLQGTPEWQVAFDTAMRFHRWFVGR